MLLKPIKVPAKIDFAPPGDAKGDDVIISRRAIIIISASCY